MTVARKFEELEIWQLAGKLAEDVYLCTKSIKDYGFIDQLQRAAVSIMNNIAEGFEAGGNKMFLKFLYISKGSCGEVRSMLYLAIKLKYIPDERALDLINNCKELSVKMNRMIQYLNTR